MCIAVSVLLCQEDKQGRGGGERKRQGRILSGINKYIRLSRQAEYEDDNKIDYLKKIKLTGKSWKQ